MAEVVVAMADITHNFKVISSYCYISSTKTVPSLVKGVSIVIRWAIMANAIIKTSRTIPEDMEADHDGGTTVVIDDPIKIFMMLMNITAIATCMIQSLLFLRSFCNQCV